MTFARAAAQVASAANIVAGLPLRLDALNSWKAATGVIIGGTKYTPAQIVAGSSPLTHYTGIIDATTNGQLIQNMWIDGGITVNANNVTVRNCYIRAYGADATGGRGGNGQAGNSQINIGNNDTNYPGVKTGLLIENCDIDGQMLPGHQCDGVSAANYTIRRSQIHGYVIGAWASDNTVWEDCLVWDNSLNNGLNNDGSPIPPGGDHHHEEAVNSDSGTNNSFTRCFFAMTNDISSITGALFWGGTWGPGHDRTITDSFLYGAGGKDLHVDAYGLRSRVQDCAFSNQGWITVGGVDGGDSNQVTAYDANMTWSNNWIPETGQQIDKWGGVI